MHLSTSAYFFFPGSTATSACSISVLAFSSLRNQYFPESLELTVYLKLQFETAQAPETNLEELLRYSTLLLQKSSQLNILMCQSV